jgi:EAL domain-containing protein (putative c-di-GMP-specific phosphodiesterase class I)
VETLEQANWLWRHGCDVLQGFLFSRPLPATEMAAYLRDLPQSRAMCPLGERAPM